MPQFAANLTMMFTEWPFLDRFDQRRTPASPRLSTFSPMSIRQKRLPCGLREMG